MRGVRVFEVESGEEELGVRVFEEEAGRVLGGGPEGRRHGRKDGRK